MIRFILTITLLSSLLFTIIIGIGIGIGSITQHEFREITFAQTSDRKIYVVDTWRSIVVSPIKEPIPRVYYSRFGWSADKQQFWYFDPEQLDNLLRLIPNDQFKYDLVYYMTVDEFFWSPDSRYIAIETLGGGPSLTTLEYGSLFPETSAIYMIDTTTGSFFRFRVDPSIDLAYWSFYDPAWSPDSSQIAYLYWKITARTYSSLFIASITSEAQKHYTLPEIVAQSLAWSPDGRDIAFSTGQEFANYFKYECGIWTLEIETGEVRKIASYCADQLQYTQDGKNLSFLTEQNEYYLLSLDDFTA